MRLGEEKVAKRRLESQTLNVGFLFLEEEAKLLSNTAGICLGGSMQFCPFSSCSSEKSGVTLNEKMDGKSGEGSQALTVPSSSFPVITFPISKSFTMVFDPWHDRGRETSSRVRHAHICVQWSHL